MTTQPNRGGRRPTPLPTLEQALTAGVSRAVLARILGVTGPRVDGWRRQGLPRTSSGRFLLREFFAWFEQRTAIAEESKSEDSEESLARYRRARAGREELLLARDRGELVDRAVVVAFTCKAIASVRGRMQDMTRKMAVRCYEAPSVEWIEERLEAETDAICQAFAHGLQNPNDDAVSVPDVPVAVQPASETTPTEDVGTHNNENEEENRT